MRSPRQFEEIDNIKVVAKAMDIVDSDDYQLFADDAEDQFEKLLNFITTFALINAQ